ncbi:MAG: hypothetical protein GTN93_21430 [Anaerolineae bacterium]|nr:hypothetical protein [Anaerolineae bacterium]
MTKLSYTPHSLPSQAILTGGGHFILLAVRAGDASYGYADSPEVSGTVMEVEKLRKKLPTKHGMPQEFLMLRSVWFDDKHGGYRVCVDLIHDRHQKPSMTAEEIKEALHDGYTWPEGQGISVGVRIVPEFIQGDGFFPNSDKYYVGTEFWEDGFRKPGDEFYECHGEWK